MRAWTLFLVGCLLVIGGSVLAWRVQTAGGVEIRDIRFAAADGTTMSALLYVPPNATPSTPAPGVLAVHGYINSRETQSGFAVEFARRGYVVLALDQTGHGNSGGAAFSQGFGGPAGLAHLRGLDIVDPANIGLEGHSMGGWAVLAAAAAMPDAYRAMVLEGSATGAPFAAEGTPAWPRNLAVVFSRYDEFAMIMWGVDRAVDAPASPKLKALFGTTADVEPGRLYGAIPVGTARVFHAPPVTHPGDHISRAAIGHSLDWFARTLDGGTPRPAADQIWIWKEVGTGVALVGAIVLMLGAFNGLLSLAPFAALHAPPAQGSLERGAGRTRAVVLSALVPALTLFPAFAIAAMALPASRWLPQAITNQVLLWLIVNAVLSLVLARAMGRRPVRFENRWLLAPLLAALAVAVGFVALLLVDRLLHVDFRFWVVALKLPSAERLPIALIYFVPITLALGVALRSLLADVVRPGEPAGRSYAAALAANTGGFVVLLAIIYGVLFVTGRLLTFWDPLTTVIAIQFIPLTAALAAITVFTYRRTGGYLAAAVISGLLVTFQIVGGTATQVFS